MDNTTKRRFEAFWESIERTRQGQVASIPLGGLGRFKEYVDIARETYYTIGGDPGSGKTAFVHWCFVLWPYLWHKHNQAKDDDDPTKSPLKLRVICHNMERPWNFIMAKWVCLRIFRKYGLLIDVRKLIGRRKSDFPDEIYDIVKESYNYFIDASDVIDLIPGAMNPTGVYMNIKDHALSNGKVIKEKIKGSDRYRTFYQPNDPNLVTIVIVDHIGKCKHEQLEKGSGIWLSDKQTIDRMSTYLAECRDKYAISPIVVQQFNRTIGETSRRTNLDLTPELRDFKGSANTVEDSDVIISLFNPWRYQVKKWKGYYVDKMVQATGHNRFRGISVLKNSYGIDDIHAGTQFIGEVGTFNILPRPKEMDEDLYREYCMLENVLKRKK